MASTGFPTCTTLPGVWISKFGQESHPAAVLLSRLLCGTKENEAAARQVPCFPAPLVFLLCTSVFLPVLWKALFPEVPVLLMDTGCLLHRIHKEDFLCQKSRRTVVSSPDISGLPDKYFFRHSRKVSATQVSV